MSYKLSQHVIVYKLEFPLENLIEFIECSWYTDSDTSVGMG